MQARCFWLKTLRSTVFSDDFWEAGTSGKIMHENGLPAALSPRRTGREKALQNQPLVPLPSFLRVYLYIDLPTTLCSARITNWPHTGCGLISSSQRPQNLEKGRVGISAYCHFAN
jgi:hypothetical protein